MPLELSVWRIDKSLLSLQASGMDLESRLEGILDQDITIANPGWFVIGRQMNTGFGSRADLLAIDVVGNLVLLELKRDQTARNVVTQALEYGAWVSKLQGPDVAEIYHDYLVRHHPERAAESFDQAFCKRFAVKEVPEDLNQSHELVVVATEFDETNERIVNYLAEEHEVAINALFFRVFKDEEREYLTRAWMRDPAEANLAPEARIRGDWNHEYYVSYGGNRDWEEARKYGFIGGGGGRFYSQTLGMLSPGDRVWVNIPGTGYVGVGTVRSRSVPLDEFEVEEAGRRAKVIDLTHLHVAEGTRAADDPEKAEYLVGVDWINAVPEAKAVKERGFFGNQNTVARPRADSWRQTVERLKQVWGVQ